MAFAKARKNGEKTFQWKDPKTGKIGTYSTKLSGEEYRPQAVYTTGLNIPQEALKQHPELALKSYNENLQQAIIPMKTDLLLDGFINGDNNKYIIGDAGNGYAAVINAKDVKNVKDAYNKAKGWSDLPEYIRSDFEDQLDKVTFGMQQVNIGAALKNAAHKDAFGNLVANPGFVPVMYEGTNEVIPNTYLREGTNQYYMTNDNGIIRETSNDKRILSKKDASKALKARYDYQRNDALKHDQEMDARAQTAENVLDEAIRNGYNPTLGVFQTTDLGADVRSGRNTFARGVNAVANGLNHTIAGAGRMALNDDYTYDDYKEGFLNNPYKSTVGVGDVFEIENPNLRFLANMVNPESVTYTLGNYYANSSYRPSQLQAAPGKKSTIYVPNQGVVTGGKFTRNNKPWQGMGTTQGNRGVWTPGGHRTQYGGTHIPISQGGKTAVTFSIPGLEIVPSQLTINGGAKTWMPIMFNDPAQESRTYNWVPGNEVVEGPRQIPYWEQNTTYSVIPNENKTSGGQFQWNTNRGKTILTMPSTGGVGIRDTDGKPSE